MFKLYQEANNLRKALNSQNKDSFFLEPSTFSIISLPNRRKFKDSIFHKQHYSKFSFTWPKCSPKYRCSLNNSQYQISAVGRDQNKDAFAYVDNF